MESFKFEVKTNVIFGEGKTIELIEIIKSNFFKSVVMIIDKALEKNEYLNNTLQKIKSEGILLDIIYNDVKEEPTYDYLDEFKSKLLKDYDCIIGVGGGSTLDLSKGMATLLKNPGKALNYRGFPELKNKSLPVIAIPTTAGSGSEATYNAVFTEVSEKRKLGINSKFNFPIYSILDPTLTLSCPEKPTVSSGADALVHCIETFVVKTTNPYSKMFAKEAFRLLFNNLPKVMNNLNDLDARGKVLLGSHFAGVAIMNAGSAGISGAMTYPLGGVFKVPHGIAGGIFLTPVIKLNVKKGFKGYQELYDCITGADNSLNAEKKNLEFVKNMEKLSFILKIPTKLFEVGVSRENITFLIDYLFNNLKGAVQNNPVEFTKEDMLKILEEMF
jgi:alcohol dehydrogenase class IV